MNARAVPITTQGPGETFMLPTDELYHICGHGEFFSETTKMRVVIDERAIEAMIAAFVPGSEILVDFDGMSLIRSERTAAAGWLVSLSARGRALVGKIRWSASGHEAVTGGSYRFLNPTFHPTDVLQIGGDRVRPIILRYIGLSNRPSMAALAPLTNRVIQGHETPVKGDRESAQAQVSGTDAINLFSELTRATQKQHGWSWERSYAATKQANPAAWANVSAIHAHLLANLL